MNTNEDLPEDQDAAIETYFEATGGSESYELFNRVPVWDQE